MNIREMAKEFGFAEAFVFSTEPFPHYERRFSRRRFASCGTRLNGGCSRKGTLANAILALNLRTVPTRIQYPFRATIPPATRHITPPTNDSRAERTGRSRQTRLCAHPRTVIRSGVGIPLKNGLTNIPGYGNALLRADAADRSAGGCVSPFKRRLNRPA